MVWREIIKWIVTFFFCTLQFWGHQIVVPLTLLVILHFFNCMYTGHYHVHCIIVKKITKQFPRQSSYAQWTTAAWSPPSSGSTPPLTTSPSPSSRLTTIMTIKTMITLIRRQQPLQGTPTCTWSPRCSPPTPAPTPASPRMSLDRWDIIHWWTPLRQTPGIQNDALAQGWNMKLKSQYSRPGICCIYSQYLTQRQIQPS